MLQTLSSGRASGPSAAAEWSPLALGGERAPLRALPDAANELAQGRPIYHVVSDPFVAPGPSHEAPLFSLTLILSRQPMPSEESILELVTGGVCAMTLAVLPSQAELSPPRGDSGRDYRPLFPRRATWAVRWAEEPEPLVQRADEGASGQGAFSFSLGREGALAVLGALRGDDARLTVECELAFRAVTARLPPLRVTVDHAHAYDALAGLADEQGLLSESDLIGSLVAMAEAEAIQVEGAGFESAASLVHALLEDLLRALMPVLRRVAGTPGEAPRRFRLGSRPTGPMSMTFQRASGVAAVERTVRLSRPLREALQGLLSEYSLDAFVRLVCPDSSGTFQPVFRRLPTTRPGPPTGRSASPLASMGPTAAALPAVLKTNPSARISAQALASSDLVLRPLHTRIHAKWALDDLVMEQATVGSVRLRHLPVIDKEEPPLWPDRITPRQFWYAPELLLVQPEPAATASTSPFLFSFRTVGHDAQGRPGLEATVRLTLRQQMPAATQAEWEARGKPLLKPVPLNGLSVSLEIPFRDEQGQTQAQQVVATRLSTSGEDVVATFQFTDRWSRLCYGALALPGFQQQPARIVTSYAFSAYVPVKEREARVAWGGKQALTEIAVAPAARSISPRRPALAVLAQGNAISPVLAHTTLAHPTAHVAVHAPLTAAASLVMPQKKTYGIRSQGRTGRQQVLVPCNRSGALYVQLTGEREVAIGCQDAFAIGQIALRLYEPIEVDLGTPRPGLRVYRSLQVPSRFLVVPERYTIARFEPGDSRGYRPAIYLFSSIDADDPQSASCVLMATLQPAVPAFLRRQLLEALRRQAHPDPQLEWPTELPGTPAYTWALATSGGGPIQPAVVKTPDGFQVSLTTRLDNVLQLKAIVERAGVSASARFPLSDGSSMETTLAIHLSRIDGPWQAGPIEVTRSDGSATLKNRVEQALAVRDLLLYTGGAQTGVVAVERQLAEGESLVLESVPPADELLPRYTPAGGAGSLDEIRTFIEDIYTNVVFMSSVDFAAQELAEITVEARIKGVPGTQLGRLTAAEDLAELRFVLPLTTYLTEPTLQFRLSARRPGGAAAAGAWRTWRLDTQGNVITITPSLLQGG